MFLSCVWEEVWFIFNSWGEFRVVAVVGEISSEQGTEMDVVHLCREDGQGTCGLKLHPA